MIGQTARLTFNPVVSRTSDPDAPPGPRNIVLPSIDEPNTYYVLEQTPVVSGDQLTDAQPSFDQNGRPAVNFRFNPTGARLFGDYTAENIGSPFAIVQNQDNREHDLLDSDDYYQFEGGAAAAIATLQGAERPIYHNDHSRPERPVIRTLDEEIGRVVRSRVVNPKWIAGVKRHGYKGAFEIAATVDYMFAFAATTGAVKSHHFDLVHAAMLEDDDTREFIAEANPAALREIAERLSEAIDRGLWQPRSNSAKARLAQLGADTQAAE